MTKIVIDKENEITKLENMLETLTNEKDKQSVRFAINVISGFNEVLSDRHNPFISKYQHDFVSRPTEVVKVGEPLSNSDEINKALEKGDLISREALKKYARVVFDKDLGRLRVVDVSDIDNAPTVEYPFYQEAYQTGYEEGYAQGYIDGSTGADMKGGAE